MMRFVKTLEGEPSEYMEIKLKKWKGKTKLKRHRTADVSDSSFGNGHVWINLSLGSNDCHHSHCESCSLSFDSICSVLIVG